MHSGSRRLLGNPHLGNDLHLLLGESRLAIQTAKPISWSCVTMFYKWSETKVSTFHMGLDHFNSVLVVNSGASNGTAVRCKSR